MNFYRRKRRMPTVIIVSLIDIFAILLIFVIVTTTFKSPQPAVTIRLPESATASAEPQVEAEIVILSVSEKGAIFLDEAPVPPDSLVAALKTIAASHHRLALRADTNAPFGTVIRILDALKEAGITGNLPAFTETIQKQKGI